MKLSRSLVLIRIMVYIKIVYKREERERAEFFCSKVFFNKMSELIWKQKGYLEYLK